ncbi:winged helix-turn-helix domain-containing protein [Candidatus Nitrosotalea okcheonensis]|uniref:Restriction endonuclease n=1 Tax=Candidatus Nitrosotalea okcheonensis TaxID=1903276 RepID=A0A2H1FIK7_9ARCH
MAIPDLETIMRPLLEFLADGKPHVMDEAENHLAKIFGLSEEEKNKMKPSGSETLFHNRIHWAKFYLKKAGLVESPPRKPFKITPRGSTVLKEGKNKIKITYLKKFQEFSDFVDRKND